MDPLLSISFLTFAPFCHFSFFFPIPFPSQKEDVPNTAGSLRSHAVESRREVFHIFNLYKKTI